MLTQFVSVYVPSTNGAGRIPKASHNAAVRRVASELSRILGGATAYPARGFWNSDTAGLVEESITIVRSYYIPSQAQEAQDICHALAAGIKAEFAQEAVTIETESGIEFI
jgi:hypothetical protein